MAGGVSRQQVGQWTALVVDTVDCIAAANKAFSKVHGSEDRRAFLDCVEVPALSFADYTTQLSTLGRDGVWPLALILADRYCRAADVVFNPHAIHRLMLTAYSIACKLCYDLRGLCHPIAKRGCVSPEDLRFMEMAFLALIDWHLFVGPDVLAAVLGHLPEIADRARTLDGGGEPHHLIPDEFLCPRAPKAPAPPPGAPPQQSRPQRSRSPQPRSPPDGRAPQEPRCTARIAEARDFAAAEGGK
eukprot:TRINITY_DN22912_c0_g1_i1.p1 TRINITY_DN22912_c0_g1~~TRINITY_DN22912_c0_g1_i1.p1  ORF type:complete len:276 (+),score=48.23 TRINITY_DN22912_c0_g1_i1:97-828(+)